jgi:hypothetical protein
MDGPGRKRFERKIENFTCEMCGASVVGSGYTDHCPKCLYGKHVDVNPGDRASGCKGLLKPIMTEHNRGGFIIKYMCDKCKVKKRFAAAKDDDKDMLFGLLGQL